MSKDEVTVCDVCDKRGKPTANGHWSRIDVVAGWYGPHKYLTGPHAHQHTSASTTADVCSAECALKYLRKVCERIEANVKAHAEWDAGEKEREATRVRLEEEQRRKRREQEENERRRTKFDPEP